MKTNIHFTHINKGIPLLLVGSLIFLGGGGCSKQKSMPSYTEQGNKLSGYSSFYEDPTYKIQFLTREFCKGSYSVEKVAPSEEQRTSPSRIEMYFDVYTVAVGKKELVQRHSVMSKKIYDGMFSEFYARVTVDYKNDEYVVFERREDVKNLGEGCTYFLDSTL